MWLIEPAKIWRKNWVNDCDNNSNYILNTMLKDKMYTTIVKPAMASECWNV